MKKLDQSVQRRVVQFLEERVAGKGDPRDFGKPMTGDKAGLWRYRVGAYRIVCRIQDHLLVVLVLRVAHRKHVYR
ncbi:MAG TPA: type II toxin-antitoxin system RelE/ParE family toxin [Terriglobia bacterium]|nr:type II toxin-antitoxin system RelE/ParE family toxin [Terriglobia bacterium]